MLFVPSDLAWYELDQLLTLIEPSLVRYAFVEPELLQLMAPDAGNPREAIPPSCEEGRSPCPNQQISKCMNNVRYEISCIT